MTSRERILCAMDLETPDRVPVTPWGLGHVPEDSEWGQRLIKECDPFLSRGVGGGNWFLGTAAKSHAEDRGDGMSWSVIETPLGDLETATRRTNITSARMVFACETADDIEKLLSIPYEPPVVDATEFLAYRDKIGGDGLPTVGFANIGAVPATYFSPVDYCLLWIEARDAFMELLRVAAERFYPWVEQCCLAGVDVFRCVGGEYASTQLGPEAFDLTMRDFDRPMVDIMHEHGAVCYYHNHGVMDEFLESLADIGIDFLDPLETPPWGDVTLAEAKARIGDRVCLVGNFDDMEVIEKVDGAPMDQLAEERILEGGPDGFCLGGTASGTYTEIAAANFVRMVEVSKRMA
jgi:uroporphyrinogen-III decarboxylase